MGNVDIGGVDTGVDVVGLLCDAIATWGLLLLVLVGLAFGVMVIRMGVQAFGRYLDGVQHRWERTRRVIAVMRWIGWI